MPFVEFCRVLALEADVSIVCAEKLDNARVTMEVRNQSADDVLATAARRAGAEVTRTGTLYYVGNLKPEDLGVLVRRVPRLTPDELESAVEVLLSDLGAVASYLGGILVVGDRVDVLRRINEMLDAVEDLPAVTWCVQLYVVGMTDRELEELGIRTEPAIDVAVTFAAASQGGPVEVARSASAVAGLTAALEALASSDSSRTVADPLFVLADGSTAEYHRGSIIPLPLQATTQGGAIQTTGYEQIETGVGFTVMAREVGRDRVRLTLEMSIDEATGSVGDYPIITGERMTAEADLESGGVYLLGSVRREKQRLKRERWLSWAKAWESERETLRVFCRAYRIAGPAGSDGAERPSGAESLPAGHQMGEQPKPRVVPVEAPKPRPAGRPLTKGSWPWSRS